MPAGVGPDDAGGDAPSTLRPWDRVLLALPRLRRDPGGPSLGERLRRAFLEPVDPGAAGATKATPARRPVADIEADLRAASDKERLVGLLAAPLAGIIGILVTNDLIVHDPPARVRGHANKLHVSVSVYHNVQLVLLGLAVAMLATAWFRKRLFLGMAMALFGLAIFNLKYWGFGIPYVFIAAWLLVRSYRVQRELREATGGSPTGGSRPGRAGGANPGRPRSNKRYTAPAPAPKRSSRKPDNQKRAG